MLNFHGFKDLIVYCKSRELAREIRIVTLDFPKEEKYALTDQVIRSSRSIGANIAEAWAKRRYVKSFVAKLIDSQGESNETTHWLDIALECDYIIPGTFKKLSALNVEIQRMLESMINNPDKFCK